jgi:hypothetical protein
VLPRAPSLQRPHHASTAPHSSKISVRLHDNKIFLAQACTDFHTLLVKYLLRTLHAALTMRIRLIGKKNFASQFKDGSKGNTELVSFELKEKYKLRSSIHRGGKG